VGTSRVRPSLSRNPDIRSPIFVIVRRSIVRALSYGSWILSSSHLPAESMGHREHPLPHGGARDHAIRQCRHEVTHTMAHAARAESAPLT